MMKNSTMLQPSEKTKQDLTLKSQVSGVGVIMQDALLMLGFSTQTHVSYHQKSLVSLYRQHEM
jgi:hypothetical protein